MKKIIVVVTFGILGTIAWAVSLPTLSKFPTYDQLGALYVIWSLAGLILALLDSNDSKRELARAIAKLEEQNQLHLEGLFIQSVSAELSGMGVLFEHMRGHVNSENNENRMKEMQRELNMAKLRYAERLGFKGVK